MVAALMICAAHSDLPGSLFERFFFRKTMILIAPLPVFLCRARDAEDTADHPGRTAQPKYAFAIPKYG